MSFAMAVLATHFQHCNEDNLPNWNMIDGANKSIKFVKEANPNLKMQLVPPHLILNHDDSVTLLGEDITTNSNKNK